ncbi:MAG: hypothetical protein ACOX22_09030 [Caldicoprobacterales bacterium]
MKKKILCIILTVLLVLPLLAACGKAPSDQPTDKPSEEPTAPATEGDATEEEPDTEELDYVELIWYIGGEAAKDEDMVMEALNEYFKEKINATVDIRWIAHR